MMLLWGVKMGLRGRRQSHWFPIGGWNAHREYTECGIFMQDQADTVVFCDFVEFIAF